jgi:arsenate reductase (glutaredoxin)
MDVWYNPSCSKCVGARAALDEARVPYRLRAYLDDPPDVAELAEVVRRLGVQPWDICRTGEPEAVDLGMAGWPRDEADAERWLAAMVAHPRLIQRPIILLDDGGAVLGRSPDAVASVVSRVEYPRS